MACDIAQHIVFLVYCLNCGGIPILEKLEPPVVLLRKQSLSLVNVQISMSAEFISSFTPEAA